MHGAGKGEAQAVAGPVAPGRLGSIPAVPVPRAQRPRRPPWHPAPSCSHRPLQMFLIILTATSRARRASQTGDSLFLWDCSPPAREGEGGSGPAHRNCSSGSGANVSHRWDLATAQLPKAKCRAGSQSVGQKGGLLLDSCCSWGLGGTWWVGVTADPCSCGCHTGCGSHRCSHGDRVADLAQGMMLCSPCRMQEGSVEAV